MCLSEIGKRWAKGKIPGKFREDFDSPSGKKSNRVHQRSREPSIGWALDRDMGILYTLSQDFTFDEADKILKSMVFFLSWFLF